MSPKEDFGSQSRARMHAVAMSDRSTPSGDQVLRITSSRGPAVATPAGETCLKVVATGTERIAAASRTSPQAPGQRVEHVDVRRMPRDHSHRSSCIADRGAGQTGQVRAVSRSTLILLDHIDEDPGGRPPFSAPWWYSTFASRSLSLRLHQRQQQKSPRVTEDRVETAHCSPGLMLLWIRRSTRRRGSWRSRSKAGTSPGSTGATEERPSWGYQQPAEPETRRRRPPHLDIQTEWRRDLAGAGAENFPSTLVAASRLGHRTLRRRPRLPSLGAVVVADP